MAEHTLAGVLRDQPQWESLPPETPAPVHRLLRRCLERDPQARLADAATATADGSFVAIYGQEWGLSSGGHTNIFESPVL